MLGTEHEMVKMSRKVNKRTYYVVKGDRVERTKQACPKCGAGVFLAEHADRRSCGSCGYTEFKKR